MTSAMNNAGLIVNIVVVMICVGNVSLSVWETTKLHIKSRLFLIFFNICYLAAMLANTTETYLTIFSPADYISQQQAHICENFFLQVTCMGMVSISLIKFFAVIPKTMTNIPKWARWVVYGLHMSISLAAIPIVTYLNVSPQTYAIAIMSNYILIAYLVWCIALELATSFTFLRSLVKGRIETVAVLNTKPSSKKSNVPSNAVAPTPSIVTAPTASNVGAQVSSNAAGIVSITSNRNSVLVTNTPAATLNNMIIFLKVGVATIVLLYTLYVVTFLAFNQNYEAIGLSSSIGSGIIAIYWTIYQMQKRFITKIFSI